jgi:lysophospholipase L1-like esterase
LAVLALLGAAEAVVRLTQPRVDGLELFVFSPWQRDDLSDLRNVRIFEADPVLFWRLSPNLDRVVWDFTVVSTNAQGFRSSRPLAAKPKGGVRIVCLGDSVTFGYRVPLAFPDAPTAYDHAARPYPEILEERLRAANPGRAIEVLNLGVPGYSSRQGLAWLKRDCGKLAPDLVTVCFGWNDVNVRDESDREGMPGGTMNVLARRIVGSSQLLLRAALRWREVSSRWRGDAPARPPVRRVSQEDYVQNLLECARVAQEHGARVVILAPLFGGTTQGDPQAQNMAAYRRALRAAAERAGLPFFEDRDFTEAGSPGNRPLFPVEPIHPGDKGHVVYSGALLRFLGQEGILASLGLAVPGEGEGTP